MKKVIIICVLVNFFFILSAQSNLQIVDEANQWTRLEYIFMGPMQFKWSYYIKMEGDTVIGPNPYLRIWESPNDPPVNWNLQGFAREDEAHYVYFRDLWEHEGLVYRFDVNPGDTFTIANPFQNMPFTVEVINVDSVYIEPENEYRKRISLEPTGYPQYFEEEWIEGIGSLAGITCSGFHAIPLTGANFTTLCMWQNGDIIYSNPQWDDCFEIVSIDEPGQMESQLSIYPLPLTDQSVVEFGGTISPYHTLQIHDMYGRLLRTLNFNTMNKIMLRRDQFIGGIYCVSLLENDRIIAQKKLIVR